MLANIAVGIALAGIVAAIIYFKAKARKQIKSSCDCDGCPPSDARHPKSGRRETEKNAWD